MSRRSFNLLTLLSWLLFVMTAAVWALSMIEGDDLDWLRRRKTEEWRSTRALSLRSSLGALRLDVTRILETGGSRYVVMWCSDLPAGLHTYRSSRPSYTYDRGPGYAPKIDVAGFVWDRVRSNDADPNGAPVGSWYVIDIVVIPYWPVALATVILPARSLLHERRRARWRRENRCQGCGYVLAGIAGNACPECGTLAAGAEA